MPAQPAVIYRVHAALRMAERNISPFEVEHVILEGEVAERYDDDTPYPSRLLFSMVAGRPLHVVAAWNPDEQEWIVITAYSPDLERWHSDYKRRRR